MIGNVWFEKYRPKSFDDMILEPSVAETLKEFVASGEMPHLILYGSPGTGKSTIKTIIKNSLDCASIEINASDERGIDTIRNKIKTFVSTRSLHAIKLVCLEEADSLTPDAQQMLRAILEEYASVSRFIFTCNYHEKIIDPIKSRCASFEFKSAKKLSIIKRMAVILDSENVTYTPETLKQFVDSYSPDIRRIINEIQSSSKTGELVFSTAHTTNSIDVELIELLAGKESIQSKYESIRKLISKNSIKIFVPLYTSLFNNLSKIVDKDSVPDAICVVAENQFQESFVVDKEITFMACIIGLLKLQ